MATPKPQIRNMFATPVCVHFLPVAPETNAELRPLIVERASAPGASPRGGGWRSAADFESWGGGAAQTLFRVARELADNLTATRTGGRISLEWKIAGAAAMRHKGDYVEMAAKPGAYWSGIYFVDDGYGTSDDEQLAGEVELGDPRGALPAMVAPHLAYRIPGGMAAGSTEAIRPQSGMIILHPAWLPRGERRFDGDYPRVTVEFDLMVP